MTKSFTEWTIKESIGLITLDSGQQNYIPDPEFLDLKLFREWIEKERPRGLIIAGKGRHFSAGADIEELKSLARHESQLLSKIRSGLEILDYIEDLNIPVMAAVRGACFGGGLEIALSAHIRVAGDTALFAFPETDLGLMPGLGGTMRLSRITGSGKAASLVLSGEIISAEKAQELNIVDYVIPGKDVLDHCMNLMKKMVEKRSHEVINAVMTAIRNAGKMNRAEAMEEESRMFCRLAVQQYREQ